MRYARTTLLMVTAGAFVLAGCGGNGASEAVGQLTEALGNDAAEEVIETDAEPSEATDAEPAAADPAEATEEAEDAEEVVTIGERTIDTAVHHGGLEYTLAQMTVVDLDAQADGEVEQRVQGVELTFDVSVFNPSNDTMSPSPQVSLRWDEPATGNVVDVSGRAEFRQVPGDSSSSGEIVVQVPPQDLEIYDDASARLVLGRSGQSPAHVAVGTQAETVDRFPVPQPLDGETFVVNDVLVTITAAEVRWDNPNGSHLEDGTVLFELTYTMENQADRQSCSTRGEGAFALTLPNGDGIVDLGVTDRCVRGGETIQGAQTGFVIDADYAGDYTLRHERNDEQDEISFTLVEADGAPAAERETR
jgi:hypothetical protein